MKASDLIGKKLKDVRCPLCERELIILDSSISLTKVYCSKWKKHKHQSELYMEFQQNVFSKLYILVIPHYKLIIEATLSNLHIKHINEWLSTSIKLENFELRDYSFEDIQTLLVFS